jgi:hypothetical protein
VCLHYLLNRLQRIPFSQPVIVSISVIFRICQSRRFVVCPLGTQRFPAACRNRRFSGSTVARVPE